jgi:DNA polymerase III subunit delta'
MAEQESQEPISLALPLPWQETMWQGFIERLDQGRLPHAMMLTGSPGIGLERLATAFAQRLLCTAELSKYVCGTCKGCQLMMAGNHPDLTLLAPLEEGKAILIDPVRDLMSKLSKTSQQGGWKVALITPAEAMNINSSNALLKSLEEPHDKTLLILLSYRPSMVSATIRSRCQVQSLSLPDSAKATRWLTEVSGDLQLAEKTLEIASGRPLLALDYMQGGSLELRQNFEELINQVRQGGLSPMGAAQQCQKLNSDQMLDWFMNYLHRLATGELQNSPNRGLFDFSDKLRKARGWVLSGSNINTQLLWEELFMDWLQVFRRRG